MAYFQEISFEAISDFRDARILMTCTLEPHPLAALFPELPFEELLLLLMSL
jgi:hypothetical protein